MNRNTLPVEDFTNSLKFQAIEWLDFNEPKESSGDDVEDIPEIEYYNINIFGVTESGNSVCLKVKNFTPFFYVKVPDFWKINNVDSLLYKLSSKKYKNNNDKWCNIGDNLIKTKCILMKKKDFYGFSNQTLFTFLRIVFDNSEAMKKCINIIKYHNNGSTKILNQPELSLYESNLDPILRYVHIKNLKFAGWIELKSQHMLFSEYKESRCQIEVSCEWNNLIAIEKDDNAKILQASYDIETYSDDGSFPLPDKKGNCIFQIATTFKYFGSNDFHLKHIICLKKTDSILDCVVECYNTEKEVLIAWKNLINKMCPDILYHYNGDQFDGNYLNTRAKMLNIFDEFSCIGKLINHKGELVKSNFSSSAYGSTDYKRFKIPGVLNFDIMIFIQREYKEDNYRLDYISEKYIGKNKNPVTPQMMFDYFKEGDPRKLKEVAEYCINDTLLPQMLVDKLHILQNQITMSNITYVPMRFLIEKGQSIKVFSQVLKETRKYDFLVPTLEFKKEDESKEEKFVGATVLPPLSGYYDMPVTVCDFASLYPSIIMAHNLCFSTIVLKNEYDNMSKNKYDTFIWEDTITVKGKGRGKNKEKDREVINKHSYTYVQNIEGILPKLLKDLSNSRKKYKKMMKDTNDPFLKAVYDKSQLAVKVSMNSVYGFLAAPMLRCKPIAATVTSIGREMIKNTKEFMENNYPNTVTVYGDTDSCFLQFNTKTTQFYKNEIHKIHLQAEVSLKDKDYLKSLKTLCIKESIEVGKKAAVNATKNLFKQPISLEYEKVYCPLFMLTKKRYIGVLYEENPEIYKKIDKKGIVLTRRDNFKLLKNVYERILNILIDKGKYGVQSSISVLNSVIRSIADNKINLDELIITKTLKSGYKTKDVKPKDLQTCYSRNLNGDLIYKENEEGEKILQKDQNLPQLVLAKKMRERDPGSAPKSNDRVPYVFIDIKSKKKEPQYKKVEDPEYVKKFNLQLDAEYYIKFLESSLCELLGLFMDNPEKIFVSAINNFKKNR